MEFINNFVVGFCDFSFFYICIISLLLFIPNYYTCKTGQAISVTVYVRIGQLYAQKCVE